MSQNDRVTELYPHRNRRMLVWRLIKQFVVWFFRNLMEQPKMKQLYEARRSPVVFLLGLACFGLIMSGIYHEVHRLIFGSPNNNKITSQQQTNHPISTTTQKDTKDTQPVSSATTEPAQTPKSVPAFHLTSPTFVFEPGPKGLKAPDEVEQVAARFDWLDNLSGADADSQAILAQIQQVTTPNLYAQLASSFSPPQDKQTWVDVKVYPVREESDGSWWINTISEAKDSTGHEQQLSLFDYLVKEGATWKVQRVAFVPPTQ
jgi:hypothetical protein